MQAGGTPARDRNHSVRPHRKGRREERQVPLHSNRRDRSVNFSSILPCLSTDPERQFAVPTNGQAGRDFLALRLTLRPVADTHILTSIRMFPGP
jgi:hypothetical protein